MAGILISGFYGFGNGGDEAVLSGILTLLRTAGRKDIAVLSADCSYTEALHGVRALPARSARTLKAVSEYDIFISGGGSLLQNATSSRSLYYYLTLLNTARLLGKKTVVFAQGIGPLRGRLHESNTVATLRRCSLVSVRDEESLDFLRARGVRARLVSDPAFLCEKRDPGDILREYGVKDDFFAVCPRPYGDNSYLEALKKAIDIYAGRTGLQPVAVPFFYPEDRLPLGITSIDRRLDFRELKGIIAASRLTVGVRLHSLIFAAAENVPFVTVSYDPKTRAFSRSFGREPLEAEELSADALAGEMLGAGAPGKAFDTASLTELAGEVCGLQ
ncbi:MAG: polysaccharide pyruvyl transferase CsaB [Abditibacteriota bacterium]|nr:polysaccharide pyruvyl transferase CsaB [Abditibacteriota bacterium]